MEKNIVLICFKYPPEYSGYGKQLKSVVTKILEIDNKTKFKLLTAYKTSMQEKERNLSIIPLGSSRFKNSGIVFYLFSLRVLFWLFINRSEYEIIHCIKAGPEAVVAYFASKILNKRLIVKVAQDELSERELNNINCLKRCYRKSRHILLRNVENYIAISEEINDNLLSMVSKNTNIIKIPNGVDTENRFKPVDLDKKREIRKLLKLPQDDIILLLGNCKMIL